MSNAHDPSRKRSELPKGIYTSTLLCPLVDLHAREVTMDDIVVMEVTTRCVPASSHLA